MLGNFKHPVGDPIPKSKKLTEKLDVDSPKDLNVWGEWVSSKVLDFVLKLDC